MSTRDEALLFNCDEAACREDPMFYEIFAMDDRWSIIRVILDTAVAKGFLQRCPQVCASASETEK